MENKDTGGRLENLKRPDFASEAHRRQLKLTLLNARRSSRAGVLLILVPCLFILGIILKYAFGINIPGFTAIENMFAKWDQTPSLKFLMPLLLAVAPGLALIINLIAITHVQVERPGKNMVITIKLKLVNILIILACLAILSVLFIHIIAEKGNHR
jgi:lantibiotic transport system permease protein